MPFRSLDGTSPAPPVQLEARDIAGRLWPVGAIALPAVVPAVALVLATSLLVWVVGLGPALARGLRHGEWERPPFRPTRILA